MQWDVYHLQARSAFHFGQRGVGIEESADYGPSDTMFSALCNALRLVTSTNVLEHMLAQFVNGTPPFLVSGAFPYVRGENGYIRFYPAPFNFQQLYAEGVTLSGKDSLDPAKARKARWMSETVFFDWIMNRLTAQTVADTLALLPGRVLVTQQEKTEVETLYQKNRTPDGQLWLWQVYEVPRVAVSRVTSASNIYQAGRLSFVPGGGLWCAVWEQKPNPIPIRLYELLQHVGEFGLGGERSAGHGQFDVQDPVTLQNVPEPTLEGQFVTLSHYHPALNERQDERAVLGPKSAYELVIRRGWMSSPDGSRLRRKPVRMVATGSVLHAFDIPALYGELVDVTPEAFPTDLHKVWRYGYALAVGMAH